MRLADSGDERERSFNGFPMRRAFRAVTLDALPHLFVSRNGRGHEKHALAGLCGQQPRTQLLRVAALAAACSSENERQHVPFMSRTTE